MRSVYPPRLAGQANRRYKQECPAPKPEPPSTTPSNTPPKCGDIHSQELALASQMAVAGDRDEIERIETELVRTRGDWTNLAAQYTEALKRYTLAVEKAHQ